MAADVNITYVNNSVNPDKPIIFVFTKNVIPTFDVITNGVAWKILPDIGRGSSSYFTYPVIATVQAEWGECCKTEPLQAEIGQRYTVVEDDSGIVLKHTGPARQSTAITLHNNVRVKGGIKANICKDNNTLVTKDIVAYNQKATFVLHPKLYWGIASEIQEGQLISSAVLDSDIFFEQDLEGVNDAIVTLLGNPMDGYHFTVENRA